jgi:hypothetical protein
MSRQLTFLRVKLIGGNTTTSTNTNIKADIPTTTGGPTTTTELFETTTEAENTATAAPATCVSVMSPLEYFHMNLCSIPLSTMITFSVSGKAIILSYPLHYMKPSGTTLRLGYAATGVSAHNPDAYLPPQPYLPCNKVAG